MGYGTGSHWDILIKAPPILVALFSGLLDWIIPIRDLVLKISCPLTIKTDDVTCCVKSTWIRTRLQWRIQGRGPGGFGPPAYCRPNLGLKGRKFSFWDRAPLIWRSGSATGLLRMVHESVYTKMLKFVFLPSVSCGSAFYGKIWLLYASCWISLKNKCLRGYDSCALKSGIICLLQCSYISKIMPIIMLVFANYAHF